MEVTYSLALSARVTGSNHFEAFGHVRLLLADAGTCCGVDILSLDLFEVPTASPELTDLNSDYEPAADANGFHEGDSCLACNFARARFPDAPDLTIARHTIARFL